MSLDVMQERPSLRDSIVGFLNLATIGKLSRGSDVPVEQLEEIIEGAPVAPMIERSIRSYINKAQAQMVRHARNRALGIPNPLVKWQRAHPEEFRRHVISAQQKAKEAAKGRKSKSEARREYILRQQGGVLREVGGREMIVKQVPMPPSVPQVPQKNLAAGKLNALLSNCEDLLDHEGINPGTKYRILGQIASFLS